MISVALATYNGEQYLGAQLDSIRRQTRKVDEIVIVDDGSSDNTVGLIRRYSKKFPECNILLTQNAENLGYKKNFQKALSLCKGDITFLCDQDDCWFEWKVEKMCRVLEDFREMEVLSSAFIRIDGDGNVGDEERVYQRKMEEGELICVPIVDLIFHNISQGCSMAIRRETKELFCKLFDETIPHDWAINIIAAMRKKCYYWNESMFYYRIHDNNTIGLNDNIGLKKKNTLEVRTRDAKAVVNVLNFVYKVDEGFYNKHVWLEKVRTFSIQHVKNLEERNLFGLLFQNFNPYYRKLKTIQGRLLDLFFCITK